MFTGIIEEIGQIISIDDRKDFLELEIESSFSNELILGDSVAINGVCLTAVKVKKSSFTVNVVEETLNKTSLKDIQLKTFVNLERAVLVSSRLNGHIVQGHVESVAKIIHKKETEEQTDLTICIDDEFLKYCIYKGSIALDGISLTIANINQNEVSVAVIPHTLNNTILKYKDEGDILNLETDVFAKYVESIIANK